MISALCSIPSNSLQLFLLFHCCRAAIWHLHSAFSGCARLSFLHGNARLRVHLCGPQEHWAVTWEVWALLVLSWVIPALPTQTPGWCDHSVIEIIISPRGFFQSWLLLGIFRPSGNNVLKIKTMHITFATAVVSSLSFLWVSSELGKLLLFGSREWGFVFCVCGFFYCFCQGFNLRKKFLGVPCEAFLTWESFQSSFVNIWALSSLNAFIFSVSFCLVGFGFWVFINSWMICWHFRFSYPNGSPNFFEIFFYAFWKLFLRFFL